MPFNLFLKHLQTWQARLASARFRGVVVLQGGYAWQKRLWLAFCEQQDRPLCLQVGQKAGEDYPDALKIVSPKQAVHWLGQEANHAFFSLDHDEDNGGIDADALGIVSGLLTAGGLCFIGLPPEDQFDHVINPAALNFLSYPHTANQALKGFNRHLHTSLVHPETVWLTEQRPLPPLPKLPCTPQSPPALPTYDQVSAIEAIERVALGHRRRPLLMTADRGRGKSAALGLAVAQLWLKGKRKIAITASRKQQAQIAFQHIKRELEAGGILAKAGFKVLSESPVLLRAEAPDGTQAALQFHAPDALIDAEPAQRQSIELLMVEEAAHLPLPMLETLLMRFSRIVFSTTLHGYEGSGRGFGLRFLEILNQQTPQWRQITLTTPIRWAQGDPLERFINRLYLNSELESGEEGSFLPKRPIRPIRPIKHSPLKADVLIKKTSPTALSKTELAQAFQLLLGAHYQTRPNDLLHLLEAPDLHLWTAKREEEMVGVLLAAEEGGLPAEIKEKGRVHGHLIPQQLFQQSREEDWLTLKGWRILRIAVAPEHQQRGVGSQLLQAGLKAAQAQALDWMGASFGATPNLIQFWQKHGFLPMMLGLKKDHASASHALTLVLPLSAQAEQTCKKRLIDYRFQFTHLLSEPPFQCLSPEMVIALLPLFHYPKTTFPMGLLHGQPFESCSADLKTWTLSHAALLCEWPINLQHSWIKKVVQQLPWQTLNQPRRMLEKQWLETLGKR